MGPPPILQIMCKSKGEVFSSSPFNCGSEARGEGWVSPSHFCSCCFHRIGKAASIPARREFSSRHLANGSALSVSLSYYQETILHLDSCLNMRRTEFQPDI
ncbi:UNVERIFIED_CONTAM: hypothetical protein K2H54_075405 [Gekko kuhli]